MRAQGLYLSTCAFAVGLLAGRLFRRRSRRSYAGPGSAALPLIAENRAATYHAWRGPSMAVAFIKAARVA